MTETPNNKLNQVLRTMGSAVAIVLALALFLWGADRFVRLIIGFVRLWVTITSVVVNPLVFVTRLLIRGIRILLPLFKRDSSA
ncbi:MAG: hypothetical protein HYZ49_20430 [Chloroflexi bacterium]|nr:hypothetical protein [Chloroflexota bacterium]